MPAASMHVPLLDLTAQYTAIQAEIRQAIDAVLESQRFVLGSNVSAFETRSGTLLPVTARHRCRLRKRCPVAGLDGHRHRPR